MFTATALTWAALGALIAAVVFLVDGGMKKLFKGTVIIAVTAVGVMGWLMAYWSMAAFNPWLVSTWMMGLFLLIAATAFRCLLAPSAIPVVLSLFSVVAFAISSFATTAPMFHAQRYGNLMAPEIKERDTTAPLVDQTQARIVTRELAIKRAAEILASSAVEGLGSRVVMGEPWGNKVGDTYFWAIPLEHSGFFKWLSHGTTPGYIAVSQMNEMNTRFVQDKPMKISVNGWFDDNVYRHLFNRGFKSQIMGEAILTPDEEWNPYWLVPMSLPQVGFGGEMPVSWSLVNAVTGDIQTFDDPADAPEWVDRLYHQAMVSERFDDWGCWSRGWSACMFSGNDVIKSTPDGRGNTSINVTLDADQNIVYYSGTQFEKNSSEGATSGFYTANARTGHITFYRRAGITEEAAKQVMKGAYADFDGYVPGDLVPLTLNGSTQAFFSIIVDNAGSRKGFAIVSQNNRNVYGKGVSVQAALTDFYRSMRRADRDASFEPGMGADEVSIEGNVLTFTSVVQGDRTSFYLTLDSLPGKIVEVSEEKIGDIVVTKVGDRVRITTDNVQPGILSTTSFDNLGFTLVEGGIQPSVDARNEAAQGGLLRPLSEDERRSLQGIESSVEQ
jgi:hypothetical protein